MKVGTKSLLFGVHQFAWHPFTVWLAWCHLYGRPTWRETVCIIIHDWGYWGCESMDGEDGKLHPCIGAFYALKWFGPEYGDLVMMHSRTMSGIMKERPSKLCWPDKLSPKYDPQWFYLIRAYLSGEIHEYRANAASSGFVEAIYPDSVWYQKLVRASKKDAAEWAPNYL